MIIPALSLVVVDVGLVNIWQFYLDYNQFRVLYATAVSSCGINVVVLPKTVYYSQCYVIAPGFVGAGVVFLSISRLLKIFDSGNSEAISATYYLGLGIYTVSVFILLITLFVGMSNWDKLNGC